MQPEPHIGFDWENSQKVHISGTEEMVIVTKMPGNQTDLFVDAEGNYYVHAPALSGVVPLNEALAAGSSDFTPVDPTAGTKVYPDPEPEAENLTEDEFAKLVGGEGAAIVEGEAGDTGEAPEVA
jgi:hypothetical protein